MSLIAKLSEAMQGVGHSGKSLGREYRGAGRAPVNMV
jgi:hypothetical protein